MCTISDIDMIRYYWYHSDIERVRKDMNTWATRIKSRMKELDLTQEELAQKMGLTRGAVTHYLAGRRIPPLKQFQKLASILKADPAWLQFGIQAEKISAPKQEKEKKEKEVKRETTFSLPVLSWQQAAELIDVSKVKRDEIKEWIPHFFTDKPRWYGLRIEGDSMTASSRHGNSFSEDDMIVIDPDKEVEHGSYVIAMLPRFKEVTFKQYVIDGGIRYLKPLNPQYPITSIDDKTHICGVVVSKICQF